jgi:hypothetical protein
MADNPRPTDAQGNRENQQERHRSETERTHAHERPMDDPGRGHGDKLEEEVHRHDDGQTGKKGQAPAKTER